MAGASRWTEEQLMDGHGQHCTFPDGAQYIAYFVEGWDVPLYTVWKRAEDGRYDYLGKGGSVGEATHIMAEDATR